VEECKPLLVGTKEDDHGCRAGVFFGCYTTFNAMANTIITHHSGRGLLSTTFRLNVSAFCGIGYACRDCLGVVLGVSGVTWGCSGCILC